MLKDEVSLGSSRKIELEDSRLIPAPIGSNIQTFIIERKKQWAERLPEICSNNDLESVIFSLSIENTLVYTVGSSSDTQSAVVIGHPT